ncbi:hypothetical protein FIBSPDRAFT_881625 [Athelia psychrophila]|uniref:Uncharacterized protein n=1 Tax=Athelia psychrophila TaxID=1759441 RepID=A0A166W655_9AGAM|nr:hypothetical protein FIBSPDRAFT_881625 [Fibularhizoctonia sp. CBS 109695]
MYQKTAVDKASNLAPIVCISNSQGHTHQLPETTALFSFDSAERSALSRMDPNLYGGWSLNGDKVTHTGSGSRTGVLPTITPRSPVWPRLNDYEIVRNSGHDSVAITSNGGNSLHIGPLTAGCSGGRGDIGGVAGAVRGRLMLLLARVAPAPQGLLDHGPASPVPFLVAYVYTHKTKGTNEKRVGEKVRPQLLHARRITNNEAQSDKWLLECLIPFSLHATTPVVVGEFRLALVSRRRSNWRSARDSDGARVNVVSEDRGAAKWDGG